MSVCQEEGNEMLNKDNRSVGSQLFPGSGARPATNFPSNVQLGNVGIGL